MRPLRESATMSPTLLGGWHGTILLGAILTLQFSLAQFARRAFVTVNLVLLMILWLLSRHRQAASSKTSRQIRLPLWGGICLIAVNAAIQLWQRQAAEGIMGALLSCTHDLCIVASLLAVYLSPCDRPFIQCLMVFCSMSSLFGVVNLGADQLGIGVAGLTDRAEFFDSRMSQGEKRWQSPLYSSWQLSGLMRVATPLVLHFALACWVSAQRRSAIVWACLGATSLWVLWRVEFRAALVPMMALSLTMAIPSRAWRRRTLAAAIVYPLLAPLLFTSPAVQSLLISILPDELAFLLGQDLEGIVTQSNRTAIWEIGMQYLLSGAHLLLGQGHFLLDCSPIAGDIVVNYSDLFRRISFHQAVLDHLFIYGTLAGTCILTSFYAALAYGIFNVKWPGGKGMMETEGEIALVFLALVAVANSHDGFLVEGNHLYVMIAIAVNSLWLSGGKWRFAETSAA